MAHKHYKHPIITELVVLRLAGNLSQSQLATKMGHNTRDTISHWEAGISVPSLENVSRWASALGCKLVLVEEEMENE